MFKQSSGNNISLSSPRQSHSPNQLSACNTLPLNASLSNSSKQVQSPLSSSHAKVKTKSVAGIFKNTSSKKGFLNTEAKPMNTTSESFPCKFCNARYNHRSSLFKHIKSCHTGESTEGGMKCQEPRCKFTCRFLNQLRQHLTLNHGIDMEVEELRFKSWKGEVLISNFPRHTVTLSYPFPQHTCKIMQSLKNGRKSMRKTTTRCLLRELVGKVTKM